MKRLTGFLFLIMCCAIQLHAQYTASSKTENSANSDEFFKKFRIGGYGEMLYQYMDYGPDSYTMPQGALKERRGAISIPRMIVAFDYKFTPDIILSSEIEFEYGGTGAGMELEYSEAGEYEFEVEKAGEVVLEQFHLTKIFSKALSLRAGHIIVPVGLTNAYHESINFFGATRPEGEMRIIPCTWHETGISVLGSMSDFSYQLMLVNGLDPNGFSTANWVRGGKQGIFETTSMNSPAFAARVDYRGIPNTRLGASAYYCETADNASKPEKTDAIDAKVTILSADGQYRDKNLIVRANVVWGDLTDSKTLSDINKKLSNKLPYARTSVAKNALTYAFEAGYNVGNLIRDDLNIFPFIRYEYYNPMEKTVSGMEKDLRERKQLFAVGANYYILPNLVLKGDFTCRRINNGKAINGIKRNNENTVSVGLAYIGWFVLM